MGTPLVQIGTYTGSRSNSSATDFRNVNLDFEPDWVLIVPAAAAPVGFVSDKCWSAKAQFLSGLPSANEIGGRLGNLFHPLNGNGFKVAGNMNLAGEDYYYIAIANNGSGLYEDTNWTGNQVDGRALNWTLNGAFDAVYAKRDGGDLTDFPSIAADRSSVWRFAGASSSVFGSDEGGTGDMIASLTTTGITVSDDFATNENRGFNRLGEGIVGCGFREKTGVCEVVTYTGDGTDGRTIATGFNPEAMILFDGVNDATADTQPHCIVTKDMASGEYKPFDATALQSTGFGPVLVTGGFDVDAEYNVSGRVYYAIVFHEASGTQEFPLVRGNPKGVRLNGSSDRITLADNTIDDGPNTLEFYCRIPAYDASITASESMPLMMMGSTAAGDANGGVYLSRYLDQDGNGWFGWCIRFMQFQSYIPLLGGAGNTSINQYNVHTGIPVMPGSIVHIVVTFDGSLGWQVHLNGEHVKDYTGNPGWFGVGNELGSTADYGGTGDAKPTIVGALSSGGGSPTFSNHSAIEVYRAAWWEGAALTNAQARSRYEHVVLGGSYTGPAPTSDYDFTVDGTADGATITGGTVVDRVAEPIAPTGDSLVVFTGESGINITSQTFTAAIPSAGRWLVGVQWVHPTSPARTISSATGAGVSLGTAIGSEVLTAGGATSIRTSFYIVETTGSGNVVVNWSGQVTFATLLVADATNLTGTGVDTMAAHTAAIETGYFLTPTGPSRVFTMGAFSTGDQSLTHWSRFQDTAFIVASDNIGSTSRSNYAEHRTQGAPTRVRATMGNATTRGIASIAVPTVVSEFSAVLPATATTASISPAIPALLSARVLRAPEAYA